MSSKAGKQLMPDLRFPEFRDSQGWAETVLSRLAVPVKERGGLNEFGEILTLSGELGIVSQGDYFGKKIAGENVDRYIGIKRNDFVYNDRSTKSFTYGAIKRLSSRAAGLVSPIYKCFRFEASQNPIFWEWYFESGSHEGQLKKLINEGARAGRYNISIDSFLSIPVWSPLGREQSRVADCLSSVDDLISIQAREIEALKAYKQGLMQQIFPSEGETMPHLRFPEFLTAPTWMRRKIGEISEVITGTTPSTSDAANYAGDRPFASPADISSDRYVEKTRTKLSEAGFRLTRPVKPNSILFVCIGSTIGKIAQNKVECATNQQINAVIPYDGYSSDFLYSSLEFAAMRISALAGRQAVPIINKSQFSEVKLPFPDLAEQEKIAEALASLDDLLARQGGKLDALKLSKSALMQRLFPRTYE